VIDVRHGTADSVTLTIRPNGLLTAFRAGQFTQLSVEIDAGVRHTCPLLDGHVDPHPGHLRAHGQGPSPRHRQPHLKDQAAVGMVVGLTPPSGEFTLPSTRPDRLLLISGGSGITPVMAMLRTLCDEGHRAPVTFVHYALTEADMIYREELADLAASHPNVRLVRISPTPRHRRPRRFLTPSS
jgi:ferredoxin-NADP reductase